MCTQQRLRSACASTQSGQCLSFPPEETLDPWLPIVRGPLKIGQTAKMHMLIVFNGCAIANLYLLLDTGANAHDIVFIAASERAQLDLEVGHHWHASKFVTALWSLSKTHLY